MDFYDPESPTEDHPDDGSRLAPPPPTQQQQQCQQQQQQHQQHQYQHAQFLQQQQQQQRHSGQRFIRPEAQLLLQQQLFPTPRFQLLLQHQRFRLQQIRQWNPTDLSNNPQPGHGRMPLLGPGVGPGLPSGMRQPRPGAVSELKDVDMRIQHRGNPGPWYFESTSALKGAQEASAGVGIAQGEKAPAVKESTLEAAKGGATEAEPALEDAVSSSEQLPVLSTPSPAAASASKEELKSEDKPKEPETLAKKLLSKALGNVSKTGNSTPPTTALVRGSNISSVPGKLAFSMKPGKVQKVSFGFRSKKNVLKTPGEGQEDEEEGAKTQGDSTSPGSSQPARFKKSMAELFRPDQNDLSEDTMQQQQLLQLTQNAGIQLLKQKSVDLSDGQTLGDKKPQPSGDDENKEESNQKESNTDSKERKSRRATRWSQPEEKEFSKAPQTDEIVAKSVDFQEEKKVQATSDKPTVDSEKQSLLDPKSKALAEISELYKDVIDSASLTEQKLKQEDLAEAVPTATDAVKTNQNKGNDQQWNQKIADEPVMTQTLKQSEGRDDHSQGLQDDSVCQKTEEADNKVKESGKKSKRGDHEKHSDDGRTHRDRRSRSRSHDRNSRRKEHDSQRQCKESGRKSVCPSDRRSGSRERRTEKSSKADRDKERRRRHRSRSEDRDRDRHEKDRSRSREPLDKKRSRSPSRSKDKSDRKHTHSQAEYRERHQQRSDSRERSKTRQSSDRGNGSERKQTRTRDRSRSVERRQTERKDCGRSVEKREINQRDCSKSAEQTQAQLRDHINRTEGMQTQHKDCREIGERKEKQHADSSRGEESKEKKRADSCRGEERQERQHADSRRGEEKKEKQHTDTSRDDERKKRHTDSIKGDESRVSSSRDVERKERQHTDSIRGDERREKHTDSSRGDERKEKYIDSSRGDEREEKYTDSSRGEEKKEREHTGHSRSEESRETQHKDYIKSVERKDRQHVDSSRGEERRERQHADHSRNEEKRQQQRKDHSRSVERRQTENRDGSRCADRRQTEHRDHSRSAERKDEKQSKDDQSSRERLDRDCDMTKERKHVKHLKTSSSSIERERIGSGKSQSRNRSTSSEKESWPKQHFRIEKETDQKSKYGNHKNKDSRSCQEDIDDTYTDSRARGNPSRNSVQSSDITDSAEYLQRRRDQFLIKGRSHALPDERRNIRSPDRGRNRSQGRGRNSRSPDRCRNDRLLDRGRNFGAEDRGRNIRSPDRTRSNRSPDRTRSNRSPDRGRNNRSSDRRQSMSPGRQWDREHHEGHLDIYRDDRFREHISEWKDHHHQYSAEDYTSERVASVPHSGGESSSQYQRGERQIREDEMSPHHSEGFRTGRDDQFLRDGEIQPRRFSDSRASRERHCFGERSDSSISVHRQSRYDDDFSGREFRTGFQFREPETDGEWRPDTRAPLSAERKDTECTDYHRDDRSRSPRTTVSSVRLENKRKSERSNIALKSMKGLKLKLKSRSGNSGCESRVDSGATDGSICSEASMEKDTMANTPPDNRTDSVSERSRGPGKIDESDVGEGRSTKEDSRKRDSGSSGVKHARKSAESDVCTERSTTGDSRKGDFGKDNVKTARQMEAVKSDKLETASKDILDSEEKIFADVSASASDKLVHADKSEADHVHCHIRASADLQENVTSSIPEQSVRADTDCKHTLHSDTRFDEKCESYKVQPKNSLSQVFEKQPVPNEKMEKSSTLKTEPQMTLVSSSSRTKTGRFGTASWSSRSKRRERGTHMAVRSKTASVVKQTSAGAKSNLSAANSETDSVSSVGSAGMDSMRSKKLSDGKMFSEATLQKTGSSVGVHDEPSQKSVSAFSSLHEDWAREASKGSHTSAASHSVIAADSAHLQLNAGGTDSRKESSDNRVGASEIKEKPYRREGDRESQSERDLKSSGREEKSRGTYTGHMHHSQDIPRRRSHSPSFREDGRNRKRLHEDGDRERWDSELSNEQERDWKWKDHEKMKSSRRRSEKEIRHADDQESHGKDYKREHKRVHEGLDDHHRHKRHHSRDRGLDMNESLERSSAKDSALDFSPISPDDSTDLNDEDDDFKTDFTDVTQRDHPPFSDTDSFRVKSRVHDTVQSYDHIHGHSPRPYRKFEDDHVERFPRPEKDRKCDARERNYEHIRERSPGLTESHRPRLSDHVSEGSVDCVFGRSRSDSTERWGEEKRSCSDFRPGSVQYTPESHPNLEGNREGYSQRSRRQREPFRSHSEEREQEHWTFTRSGSLERDQRLSSHNRDQSERGERDRKWLASHSSHDQGGERRFTAHNRSRSNSRERDRSWLVDERVHGQENRKTVFVKDAFQGQTPERDSEVFADVRSHRQLETSVCPEALSESQERDRRHFAYGSGQMTLDEKIIRSGERSSTFGQETDPRQYSEENFGNKSFASSYRELYPEAMGSQLLCGRGGVIDMERGPIQEQGSMRPEDKVEQGSQQNQSQLKRSVQPESGHLNAESDPGHSTFNRGHSSGGPRFERGLSSAFADEVDISSRIMENRCVPPPAKVPEGLPHIIPSVCSAPPPPVGHVLTAHSLPDPATVQYPPTHSGPHMDWPAAAYLNQVDPASLQMLMHQYQVMGYSPDQALASLTQSLSSAMTQHVETVIPHTSLLHGTNTTGPEPAALANVAHSSVFVQHGGHQQGKQGQQLSADLLHQHSLGDHQSNIYSPNFTHLHQAHAPLKCLPETGVFQAEHTSAAHMLASTIPQEIRQQSVELPCPQGEPSTSSGLPGKLIKTSKHLVEIQSTDEPNLSLETSSLPDPEGRPTETESEIKPSHEAHLTKEEEGVVSSTNSGESEVLAKEQGSSSKDLSKQPLKVKSRWRRSCEAEALKSLPAPQLPDQEEAESSSPGKRNQDGESTMTLSPHKRQKLSAEIGQLVEAEAADAFPTFQRTQDNIHVTQRKRSKSMKRMQCDCTSSKADRAKGVPSCGDDCLNRMLMIECGSRCPCLTNCSNKRFQKKQYAKTEPFYCGPGKGWGLKVLEDLPHVGTFVLEYVGELLGYKEFVRRTRQYSRQGLKHHYFMALNADEVIDATLKGSNSRFLNHSCDPNCETQKWTVNGELRVGFFTKKPVKTGEELTFDYQFEFYGEPQKCCCGAENCRGFIGGLKKFPLKKKKRERPWEHRKLGLFEDEMLDEDMDSISSCLEDGMKLREHVLDLCRLMVRARKPDHRLSLLKILQNTTEVNCLRLFLGYQGLPLLWSWMVDLGDSEDDGNIKMQVLSVLQKLPITNRTVLKESKIMNLVEKWASLPGPPPLPDAEEADSVSEPVLPLPLPVPPDRPVVSILALHKDTKVRNTAKKRVTFADEAAHSDSDVVSSTNSEVVGEGKAFVCPPTGLTAGDDDTVSTSEAAVLSSSDLDVRNVGETSKKEGSCSGSDGNQDLTSESSLFPDGQTVIITDSNVGTSVEDDPPVLLTEVDIKEEEAAPTTLAKELTEDMKEVSSDSFEQNDNGSTKADTDCASEKRTSSKLEERCSPLGLLLAESTKLCTKVEEVSAASPVATETENSDQTRACEKSNRRQLEELPEDGSGPPQLECMGERDEEDLAVPSTSQVSCFEEEDEEMPTLVKEGGECAEEDAETEELDPVYCMASQLLGSWSGLKELYKIPKKQRLEERKKTERELESAKPEDCEPDPYALWKKNKVERSKKKDSEEEEKKRSQAAAAAASAPRLPKEVRRQLFEAQVKAEEEMNAELQRQQEAVLQQQQAAASLILQQNPALAAVLQSLGQQDPHFVSPQGHPGYDSGSGSQVQYSSMMTAEQHQALLMAVQAAGGDVNMLTEQLLSQQRMMAQAMDPSQQVHAAYGSPAGTQVYPDPAVLQQQQHHQQQQQLQQQQLMTQHMEMTQQMMPAPPPQLSPTLAVPPAQCQTPTEDEDVPPPPSPLEQGSNLPEHWKMARDAEGRVYFYNILTRATQWDLPTLDGSSSPCILNMDTSTEAVEDEDGEEESKRRTTTAAADTSSEVARKIKERFRKQMSKFVVIYLNPYRRPDCKVGRIQTTEDFKHLARRLTHHVLAKELKHCRHVEDLEVNENVKAKARDYVRKYMSRCGPVFKKSSSPDDFHD